MLYRQVAGGGKCLRDAGVYDFRFFPLSHFSPFGFLSLLHFILKSILNIREMDGLFSSSFAFCGCGIVTCQCILGRRFNATGPETLAASFINGTISY